MACRSKLTGSQMKEAVGNGGRGSCLVSTTLLEGHEDGDRGPEPCGIQANNGSAASISLLNDMAEGQEMLWQELVVESRRVA